MRLFFFLWTIALSMTVIVSGWLIIDQHINSRNLTVITETIWQ